MAVAFHVPEVRVPTDVREDAVTPVPRVVPFRTDAPLIENAFPEDRLTPPVTFVLSDRVISPVPESITMLPVVAPPRVRVWLLVVAKVPSAVIENPPASPADRVAVGVPEATLRNAILADDVVAPPSSRSTLGIIGERAPLDRFHLEAPDPAPGQGLHDGAEPETLRHVPSAPIANLVRVVPDV
jgi:hypothetical protein